MHRLCYFTLSCEAKYYFKDFVRDTGILAQICDWSNFHVRMGSFSWLWIRLIFYVFYFSRIFNKLIIKYQSHPKTRKIYAFGQKIRFCDRLSHLKVPFNKLCEMHRFINTHKKVCSILMALYLTNSIFTKYAIILSQFAKIFLFLSHILNSCSYLGSIDE